MKEMITVEKEVYEAVLRNSVRVNDLEAENEQLKELLSKARDSVQFDFYEAIGGGADYQAKFLKDLLTAIDNAIGEKK